MVNQNVISQTQTSNDLLYDIGKESSCSSDILTYYNAALTPDSVYKLVDCHFLILLECVKSMINQNIGSVRLSSKIQTSNDLLYVIEKESNCPSDTLTYCNAAFTPDSVYK